MESTAILIIPTPEGDKYEYARKWKIPCVSPDWVFDSIEKGFCQSTTPFRIDQQQVCCPIILTSCSFSNISCQLANTSSSSDSFLLS